jgi:hypothetical protein
MAAYFERFKRSTDRSPSVAIWLIVSKPFMGASP